MPAVQLICEKLECSIEPKTRYFEVNLTIPKTHPAYGFCSKELPITFPSGSTTFTTKNGQTFKYELYTDEEKAKVFIKNMAEQLQKLTLKDIIEFQLKQLPPKTRKHVTIVEA
ncbi:MAG: hypothetical protein LBC12_00280 [Nitrososphaerota archaeon]|jgi:hypothetical protein|nr:hypothetical protein [Nitrososphaerota archaeon]